MTIASKLETINEALGDIKDAIVAKGVTPTGDITTYSTAIDSISTPDVWYNWKTDIAMTNNTSMGNIRTGNYPTKVVYGNGVYLAKSEYIGASGSSTSYYYSSNGTTWESKTLPGNAQSIAFGKGVFVAAGAYNDKKIFTSTDGLTWSTINIPNEFDSNYVVCSFAKDMFFIAPPTSGRRYAYSTDGISWTFETGQSIASTYIYGNDVYVGYSYDGGSVYISSDGINWTSIPTYANLGNRLIKGMTYGNGLYVIITTSGNLFTTTDFSTFNYRRNVDIASNFPAFGNGIFVCMGKYSGGTRTVYYSSNGKSWLSTTINQTSSNGSLDVGAYFANGYFFVSGYMSNVNRLTFDQSQCYTLTASPTTSTQVYEIPKKTSALIITAVGTGTITLSDTKVYNRNSAGDVESPVLGTKTITSNDTYTAASDYLDGFSSVTVDVLGIPREVSAQGVYQMPSTSFTFSLPSNITDVGAYALSSAFYGCATLTTVDLSSLTAVSGDSEFSRYGLSSAFRDCTGLTSVDLSSLTRVDQSDGFYATFNGCTSLTSVDLSSLIRVWGGRAFQTAFGGCTSLTNITFPALTEVMGDSAFIYAFYGCTNIESISFPALTTDSFFPLKNQFDNLMGNTGSTKTHTLHFPSNLQSTISQLTGYPTFGGTSGYVTCVFDLPSTQ